MNDEIKKIELLQKMMQFSIETIEKLLSIGAEITSQSKHNGETTKK